MHDAHAEAMAGPHEQARSLDALVGAGHVLAVPLGQQEVDAQAAQLRGLGEGILPGQIGRVAPVDHAHVVEIAAAAETMLAANPDHRLAH